MSTPPACLCNVCSARIEFDESAIGQTISCPGCGADTVLYRMYSAGRLKAQSGHRRLPAAILSRVLLALSGLAGIIFGGANLANPFGGVDPGAAVLLVGGLVILGLVEAISLLARPN